MTSYKKLDTENILQHIFHPRKEEKSPRITSYNVCYTKLLRYLGYRLSLNSLARDTLGEEKAGDGLQALKWYKEGNIEQIIKYCKKDVSLTLNLLVFALENGYLLFSNKAGRLVRLPLQFKSLLKMKG